ncbi:uncharacterized protein LOC141638900 [Silene latifolia]|uniref:uncharacterized protein LOC141638900 n=1 Tax=Silene latifolia TaxID=37657 RepID=UPI003D782320
MFQVRFNFGRLQFCYVLGANPPSSVLAGFVKRVWQAHGFDKISFMPNGIFLIRFKTKEKQQAVLNTGHLLFDNKPVIVNEWKPETVLVKHDVKRVPIWMKFYGLDIKFWGLESLKKLSGVVGTYVKCDEATTHRNFLGYARVLIEVDVDQYFPNEIYFLDENGLTQTLRVVYDWLPLTCTICKGMGHTATACRKGDTQITVKKKKVHQVPKDPVQRQSVRAVASFAVPMELVTPRVASRPVVESSLP